MFTTLLEANAAIEVANTCLSASIAMVVMDPYEAKSSYALQCNS
jgi:hypothetical protein